MRPLNNREEDGRRVWKTLSQYSSVTQTTNTGQPLPDRIIGRTFFSFDKVFGEESGTTQVYEAVAKGIVSSVVTGLNGTIFAYGQTSSGKTFTMQGAGGLMEGWARGQGGIVQMAAEDIFRHIQDTPDRMFLVRASFIEIYNEEVRDLLGENQVLTIREDPKRGTFVQSAEEVVTDCETLFNVLLFGEKNRAIASTAMNERSSRSHTIFRITVESRAKGCEDGEAVGSEEKQNGTDGAVLISTLNLVDLAGSESVRHTGATGERQKEGGKINQR
jgi:centromeric protein E